MTRLHIGNDLVATLTEFCGQHKAVIIADEAIRDLYAVQLGVERILIPSGEKAKSWEVVQMVVDRLSQMGCGRDTILIALGGGSTSDLVGFVASIYLRGVCLALVPTTLLAMVDASIGGKTAINTQYGKNLVGTIYFPKAIFIDLDLLKTLPEKEKFNGLAEILKMGLIYDRSIWDQAMRLDRELISKNIEAKMAIVKQDPTEQGLRRILNFGHTIGHALEAVSEYTMPHGQAVAIGCLVESYLSMQLGYLAKREFEKIEAVYRQFPLSLPTMYQRSTFLQAMMQDKKKKAGTVRFVLIDQIGRAMAFDGSYCSPATREALDATLDWMESLG